jgi:hypothetical protein
MILAADTQQQEYAAWARTILSNKEFSDDAIEAAVNSYILNDKSLHNKIEESRRSRRVGLAYNGYTGDNSGWGAKMDGNGTDTVESIMKARGFK